MRAAIAVAAAVACNVWRRRTDAPEWEAQPVVAPKAQTTGKLEALRGDDWLPGVSAIATDGSERPVASAVSVGGYEPLAAQE